MVKANVWLLNWTHTGKMSNNPWLRVHESHHITKPHFIDKACSYEEYLAPELNVDRVSWAFNMLYQGASPMKNLKAIQVDFKSGSPKPPNISGNLASFLVILQNLFQTNSNKRFSSLSVRSFLLFGITAAILFNLKRQRVYTTTSLPSGKRLYTPMLAFPFPSLRLWSHSLPGSYC
jgi:hypothetical protein